MTTQNPQGSIYFSYHSRKLREKTALKQPENAVSPSAEFNEKAEAFNQILGENEQIKYIYIDERASSIARNLMIFSMFTLSLFLFIFLFMYFETLNLTMFLIIASIPFTIITVFWVLCFYLSVFESFTQENRVYAFTNDRIVVLYKTGACEVLYTNIAELTELRLVKWKTEYNIMIKSKERIDSNPDGYTRRQPHLYIYTWYYLYLHSVPVDGEGSDLLFRIKELIEKETGNQLDEPKKMNRSMYAKFVMKENRNYI